jgi:hypothetical protein
MDQGQDISSILVSLGGRDIGGEVNFLCPYVADGSCDDHSKGSMNGRFYVGTESGAYPYICFKCGRQGYLDSYLLQKLGASKSDSRDMMRDIAKSRKDIGFDFSYSRRDRRRSGLIYPTKASRTQLDYLKNRMGINITSMIANKFNIILNLREFAEVNKDSRFFSQEAYEACMSWAPYSIGFLSDDESHVIFRNIGKTTKENGKYGSAQMSHTKDADKLYRVSENRGTSPVLDVMMAEGQLDILGLYIYMSRNPSEFTTNDKEFLGVSGIRYHSALERIIDNGEIRPLNVYVFKDAEVPDGKIINRMKQLPIDHFHLVVNTKAKDTGDPVKDGPPVFEYKYVDLRKHRRRYKKRR